MWNKKLVMRTTNDTRQNQNVLGQLLKQPFVIGGNSERSSLETNLQEQPTKSLYKFLIGPKIWTGLQEVIMAYGSLPPRQQKNAVKRQQFS